MRNLPAELGDHDAQLDPFPWFREMRESNPVRYDEDRATWDVFRYDDVTTVLGESETFSADVRGEEAGGRTPASGRDLLSKTMMFSDPPRHGDLRSAADHFFKPDAIRAYEPQVRELATALLDDGAGGDELDAVADVAYPLTATLTTGLLGVPAEDRQQVIDWARPLLLGPDGGADFENRVREAQVELVNYFEQLVAAREAQPRDDLVSGLLEADVDGPDLDHEEVLGFCMMLLIAGNVGTRLITNVVRCLREYPDRFADLETDSSALGTAIEEVLRFRPPTQSMSRIVREDTALSGVELAEGDRVVAWIGSANHDERAFDDPESFVLDRDPNPHVAFGTGIHYCLGASLARLEAQVVLEELLARIESVTFPDADLRPTESPTFIYSVESLPFELSE